MGKKSVRAATVIYPTAPNVPVGELLNVTTVTGVVDKTAATAMEQVELLSMLRKTAETATERAAFSVPLVKVPTELAARTVPMGRKDVRTATAEAQG